MKSLVIGDLVASKPIIQGGMGVGISMGSLAGAVAKEGGIGVISAAQPGFKEPDFYTNTVEANMRALSREIKRAKEISNGGIVGVNIMVAVTHYDRFVECCIESGADVIISGAGLPMDLPKYAGDKIKIAPIISSVKACKVVFTRWLKKNNRVADFVVIEGPKAGGHLGFKADEIMPKLDEFDDDIRDIIAYVREFEKEVGKHIPVIVAGGVFTNDDVKKYLAMGAEGCQIASRFVATRECDADIRFKQAYVDARPEDAVIVKSPVGMPGRALNNHFIREIVPKGCKIDRCFNCLNHCDPKTIPYCISKALFNAALGDLDNGLIFCGANVGRINRIATVKELMDELTAD